MATDIKTLKRRQNVNWSVICYDLAINFLFNIILQKLYKSISLMIITYYQFAISDLVRPWYLFQQHFGGAILFYSVTLCFIGLLICQLGLLLIGLPFFSNHNFNTRSLKILWIEMKNKLILRNVIQLLGLWLICLPLSSFLVMQDYFATFRFTEAYLYFIRGSGTIKPVISGLILMYIGIYWLVMHRMGLQRRIHQFPVKMAWVTLKLAFIYIIIAAGVAFIGLLGAKGLWLSLIIMRAVRWTLGLWWWQKLLGKKIYIVTKKQPDIRLLSQCSVLMLALLLWLPQSTVSAKSNAWLAHKGLNGTNGVENSISILKRTAKAHPDYVEMDVRYTKDQKFIVIHDHKLQRLTGQKGAVEDYTLAQLRRLQARTNGYQARLSSFDAYLTTAQQQHQKLLVELKTVPTQNKNKFVQAFLNRYQDQLKANGALIHSSDPKIVQAVKQQAPAQSVGYIVPFTYWGMPKLAADFYSIEGNSYDLKTANKILKNHKKVYIWTISDPLQLEMNNLKYHNGVISDRFSELKSVMKSFKEKGGYYKMVWVYVSVLNP